MIPLFLTSAPGNRAGVTMRTEKILDGRERTGLESRTLIGGAVRSASNVSNADLLFGCFCYGAKRDEPGEGPAMHTANASGLQRE